MWRWQRLMVLARALATKRASGSRVGSTVIQVYIHDPVAERSQPVRRLVGHQRIELEPGAKALVTVTVPLEALAYTHRDGQRRIDPGEYHLYMGQHASDGEKLVVTLPG